MVNRKIKISETIIWTNRVETISLNQLLVNPSNDLLVKQRSEKGAKITKSLMIIYLKENASKSPKDEIESIPVSIPSIEKTFVLGEVVMKFDKELNDISFFRIESPKPKKK